jgi:hypothetical protein
VTGVGSVPSSVEIVRRSEHSTFDAKCEKTKRNASGLVRHFLTEIRRLSPQLLTDSKLRPQTHSLVVMDVPSTVMEKLNRRFLFFQRRHEFTVETEK